MALLAYEARKCPTCGNYDTIVAADPPETGPARVTWPDGRSMDVRQWRCLACGSVDLVRRDYMATHEKDPTMPGHAAHGDGRLFSAKPAEGE